MAGEFMKIYTEQGGAKEVVASGGEIEVQSGATLDCQSGCTTTLAGTNTISGATSLTAALTVGTGGAIVNRVQTKAANYTVTAADSGSTFVATAADVVFTLPSTAAGLTYTFINGSLSTGTGMSASPAAADKIMGSTDGYGFTSADNKDAINTGATDVLGDSITLIGDGVDGWYITHATGVWAREA
jgi:hypothetical protein